MYLFLFVHFCLNAKTNQKNQDERRLVRSNTRSIVLCARSTKFPSGLGIHALYENNESILRSQTNALAVTNYVTRHATVVWTKITPL